MGLGGKRAKASAAEDGEDAAAGEPATAKKKARGKKEKDEQGKLF
jgi:hypothetical protein